MRTLNWNETTSPAEILQAAEGEDVVLLRHGHAVALIVPFDDDDLEWYARERDPAFLAAIAQAREQVGQGRTRTHEDLKRELGLACPKPAGPPPGAAGAVRRGDRQAGGGGEVAEGIGGGEREELQADG